MKILILLKNVINVWFNHILKASELNGNWCPNQMVIVAIDTNLGAYTWIDASFEGLGSSWSGLCIYEFYLVLVDILVCQTLNNHYIYILWGISSSLLISIFTFQLLKIILIIYITFSILSWKRPQNLKLSIANVFL